MNLSHGIRLILAIYLKSTSTTFSQKNSLLRSRSIQRIIIKLQDIGYTTDWDFEKTMEELWKVARSDDIITQEEQQILDRIEIDAELYTIMLEECLADGIIDEHEAYILKDIKDMIQNRAVEIAQADGVFDQDEKAIIKKLSEILPSRYSNRS